ncbi:Ig-like domain-containing protein [Arachnia propionica]|uniref:Ig-like domain-containing protein n=1 Tax=Arachnia propionica TaxID=1750 RepID=UPI00399025FB
MVINPAARAAEVSAIDSGSIRVTKTDQGDSTIYMYSNVRVDANWSIPDGTGHAGDTFKMGLPEELGGIVGSFELKGKEGDPLVYGTCQVARAEVVCTLNATVEGKNNVGGSLWVRAQVIKVTEADKFVFTLRGNVKVDVPLPNGQKGIGYNPKLPTDIEKSGWFASGDPKGIRWNIVVPGAKIADRSRTVITDTYGVQGTKLTLQRDSMQIFWIPNTPKCWTEITSPECRHNLDSSTTPSVNIAHDENKDVLKVTVDNKGQNFQADRIYVLNMTVKTDTKIINGSRFTNTVTVDGEKRTSTAVKSASGGGTGSGDTVGHIGVKKAVVNGNVPGDTVFPVTWTYEYDGETYTGELALGADGTVETLNNVPNGVVVTLTERVPVVAGFDFGDPVFSGAGVSDGIPDANSARVKVEGMKTVEVTLTNPVTPVVKPVLSRVEVTPGVCAPGASEPSEPTVEVGPTDGITYSVPEFSKAGDQVTVKVTATPAAGREIDDQNLPAGWVANGDGSFTFTTTVTQPRCVTPVAPRIDVGTCPADSLTPTPPSAVFDPVEGLEFSEPKIEVRDGKVTVTATATAKPGFQIGGVLPEGWTRVDETTATFTATRDQPVCQAKKVVPVAPVVSASVCRVGSTAPSEPEVTLPTTEGIVYAVASREFVGGKFRYTVTAAPAGEVFVIDADRLGAGWGAPVNGVSTYTGEVDVPACVTPVAPKIDVGTCPVGATTPTPPSASFDPVEGLEFSEPKIEVRDGKVTVTATATAKPGFQIGGVLPEGWTRVDETTAEFSATRDQPVCDAPTPTPSVPPSVTPTPAPTTTVTPRPVKPGLPKTGA